MNLAILGWALYLSEGWYEHWRLKGRIYSKARGIVLFDRVITDRIPVKGAET